MNDKNTYNIETLEATKTMNTSISNKKLFESIAVGWSKIEPIIVTCLALSKPTILEGTHGICKSTLGREISRIIQVDSYLFSFPGADKIYFAEPVRSII